MPQTIDDVAEQLVKFLAAHPRIDFEVDKELFKHIISSKYNPKRNHFSTKLPKGKMQQLVQTLRVESQLNTIEAHLESGTVDIPLPKAIAAVRYEKNLSLRRILRNDMALYSIPASQQNPFSTVYHALKLVGNISLRVLWDPVASGLGHASAAESRVRRLPKELRQLMYDSYKSGNPISVLGRLKTTDHITQINDYGHVYNEQPFFVITTPIIIINGVAYRPEDYKDPSRLSDERTVPGFEEGLTVYEKAVIPSFMGNSRDLLVRVTRQQYEQEVAKYLESRPQLKKAVEACKI